MQLSLQTTKMICLQCKIENVGYPCFEVVSFTLTHCRTIILLRRTQGVGVERTSLNLNLVFVFIYGCLHTQYISEYG